MLLSQHEESEPQPTETLPDPRNYRGELQDGRIDNNTAPVLNGITNIALKLTKLRLTWFISTFE